MDQKGFFQKGWNIAKLFLAVLLVFFVVSKTNFAQIKTIMGDIAWGWFAIHFFSFIVMTLLKAYQYHVLIGKRTKYKKVLRIVIWQNAISNFISNSAGVASYMAMLKAEQNVKLTRSGVVFLITKFGDLLAICLYLAISAAVVWNQIQSLRWITLILIIGMIMGLATFLVTVLWRERFVALVAGILASLKLNRFSLVSRGVDALRSIAQERQTIVISMLQIAMLLSFIYMTVTMVYTYTSIRMFGVQLGIWSLIYVATLMQLVSFVPIQVLGGLGVTEVTSVYLYSLFGLDQGKMSAVLLGWRAIFYLMNAFQFVYLPTSAFLGKNTKQIDS